MAILYKNKLFEKLNWIAVQKYIYVLIPKWNTVWNCNSKFYLKFLKLINF